MASAESIAQTGFLLFALERGECCKERGQGNDQCETEPGAKAGEGDRIFVY